MRGLLLLVLAVSSVSCHSVTNPEVTSPPPPGPKDKGFIEWVTNLLGGGATSTSKPNPTEPIAPENCPPCKCGMARTKRRIIGGTETAVLEFPWMAALKYGGRFYCGAALINNLYVLTAAHCSTGFRKEKLSVHFLEHDRSVDNETKPIVRQVSRIIPHHEYNAYNFDNDIALMKLSAPVDITSGLKRLRDDTEMEDENLDVGVRPVCMPQKGDSYRDATGIAVGWGTTMEGGAPSNTLQKVSVRILSNDECHKTDYRNRITKNMLCAGEADGGRDACQGDSGGPLHVVNTTNEHYEVVGVVSWGEGCARPNKPGVYSRVNRYLTWIKTLTPDACYC